MAKAIDVFDGQGSIVAGLARLQAMGHAQTFHQTLDAHGLAGFRPADLQHMAARRGASEVVVKADRAMDLGAGDVQRLGDEGNDLLIDATEGFLQGVQDGQQGAFQMRQPAYGLARAALIKELVRT